MEFIFYQDVTPRKTEEVFFLYGTCTDQVQFVAESLTKPCNKHRTLSQPARCLALHSPCGSVVGLLLSYLCRSSPVVSGGYPPHCPFPSISVWLLLTLSALLVRSKACCMAKHTPPAPPAVLTPPPSADPRTPPSLPPLKITIAVQRQQMMSQLSLGCSVLLAPHSMDRGPKGVGGPPGGKTGY